MDTTYSRTAKVSVCFHKKTNVQFVIKDPQTAGRNTPTTMRKSHIVALALAYTVKVSPNTLI